MTSIQTHSQSLQQAVAWISEQRRDSPALDDRQLIEQACVRFNLTPKDAEYLGRQIKAS